MEQPIVIHLTLERMQHHITQALLPREVELKERIEQAVQQAVSAFDFEAEIQRQVQSALREQVHRKVEWMIREALQRENAPLLEKIIQAEVERQLREQAR